jgi:hypothetical protein
MQVLKPFEFGGVSRFLRRGVNAERAGEAHQPFLKSFKGLFQAELHAKFTAIIDDIHKLRADEVLGGQDKHVRDCSRNLLDEEAVVNYGKSGIRLAA